jgi:DNA ligase-1
MDISFQELIFGKSAKKDISKPYPFFLAYPLESDIESLGDPAEWLAEWKWDGIRSQIVKREGQVFIWSRGEELITDRFPELTSAAGHLPNGTVIDGEILPVSDHRILPFQVLQTRITRKKITRKLLETTPVKLFAYDLTEFEGEDIRSSPLLMRRNLLTGIIKNLPGNEFSLSMPLLIRSWQEAIDCRAQARTHDAEGLMLKKLDSPYLSGRKKGFWLKWKCDPFTIDGVLIYAQKGHGRRANLYTDYTFAVWDGDELVPFTKAYSGLTDAEFVQVDRFVKQNTLEKFGPVRSVIPSMVFEIAFEGITRSKRHKSGIALRFPRMVRIRFDKPAREAATLAELEQLLGD